MHVLLSSSLFFDVIFMIQHYCLYPRSGVLCGKQTRKITVDSDLKVKAEIQVRLLFFSLTVIMVIASARTKFLDDLMAIRWRPKWLVSVTIWFPEDRWPSGHLGNLVPTWFWH